MRYLESISGKERTYAIKYSVIIDVTVYDEDNVYTDDEFEKEARQIGYEQLEGALSKLKFAYPNVEYEEILNE